MISKKEIKKLSYQDAAEMLKSEINLNVIGAEENYKQIQVMKALVVHMMNIK